MRQWDDDDDATGVGLQQRTMPTLASLLGCCGGQLAVLVIQYSGR